MVTVLLIMVIEAYPFLTAISVRKRGINIKKHEFRFLDGINRFAHGMGNAIKLLQCVRVHTVIKPGQGRLGSEDILVQDRSHNRFICQFICTVVFETGADNLVDCLQKIVTVFMDAVSGGISCYTVNNSGLV